MIFMALTFLLLAALVLTSVGGKNAGNKEEGIVKLLQYNSSHSTQKHLQCLYLLSEPLF